MHELFRGTRLTGQNHTFLREVHLDIQLIHRNSILQVSVEPISLLY